MKRLSEQWTTCVVWDCPDCEGLSFERCEHEVPHGDYWKELIDRRALDSANARQDGLQVGLDAADLAREVDP